MSRVSEVIKNKNKVEKARRIRRRNEMMALKNNSAFKAKLFDELKHVEVILSDSHVESITVQVPDNMLPQFSNAIYSEDLASYEVQQVNGEPNKFSVRKKYIDF